MRLGRTSPRWSVHCIGCAADVSCDIAVRLSEDDAPRYEIRMTLKFGRVKMASRNSATMNRSAPAGRSCARGRRAALSRDACGSEVEARFVAESCRKDLLRQEAFSTELGPHPLFGHLFETHSATAGLGCKVSDAELSGLDPTPASSWRAGLSISTSSQSCPRGRRIACLRRPTVVVCFASRFTKRLTGSRSLAGA
jgi:hypothetical protein